MRLHGCRYRKAIEVMKMVNDVFMMVAKRPKAIDITGERFGRLTAIKRVGKDKRNNVLWLCKCDCGNEVVRATSELKKRNNHSCGCLGKEHLTDMAKANITHGMSKSRLYGCYKGMMSRCYRQSDIHYKAYGGRGITVCDEWKNDSKAFIDWALTNGYSDDLTIERIDVNGNYEPSNCTWIPMSEQYDNKRQNVMIEWNGERHNATYWSRVFGIPATTIRWRYKHGWSIERIFATARTV